MDRSTAARPSVGGWLIMDRFIHRRDEDKEDDVTMSDICHTCIGSHLRASIRFADPPAVSRLRLHWPGRPEIRGLQEPHLIAAHDRCILFQAIVPFEDPTTHAGYTSHFPVDLFVYSAYRSPPSLHRLPVCFTGGVSDPDEDKYFRPYRWCQQRFMDEQQMGILCHPSDESFAVVDFTHLGPGGELCLLHYCPRLNFPLMEDLWVIKKVQWPQGPSANYWVTDAIVPFKNRFLCWVDCYQGILVVDILLANRKDSKCCQVRYIPLPDEEALKSDRPYPDGECPDPARRVCVTADNVLVFVCITRPRTTFTVKSWTLADISKPNRWVRGHTIDAFQFKSLCKAHGLPCVKPEFPLVSLAHSDQFFFLLKEDSTTYWIVGVNMKDKKVMSSAIYVHEEEEDCTPGRDRRNVFDGHSFIPTQLSRYFPRAAITKSLKLSQMMQNTKHARWRKRCQLAELKKHSVESSMA